MIRRKSDAAPRVAESCKYHRSVMHERGNQLIHEQRQRRDEPHDVPICWCCCADCTDLSWYHEEPPSLLTPEGDLRPRWNVSGPTSTRQGTAGSGRTS